jgi:hypothetical protein
MYLKSNFSPFFKKAYGNALHLAKGTANFLDNGLVQGAITAIAPEIGLPLTAISKSGFLQKVKDL